MSIKAVNCGVPQGLTLDPGLFLLYKMVYKVSFQNQLFNILQVTLLKLGTIEPIINYELKLYSNSCEVINYKLKLSLSQLDLLGSIYHVNQTLG